MEIRKLDREDVRGVWSIDRAERIDHVYRYRGGALVRLSEHHDVQGWPEGEAERDGPTLLDCFDRGGPCHGAFDGRELIGAAVLECRFIGRPRDQLQLKFLHVSRRHRGTGIGRALFDAAVTSARELGARRLYVSATPSENTVRFYLRRGCRVVAEPDADLLAREPEDIHLECDVAV